MDLFAKMVSAHSSCYIQKSEGEAGSASESPNTQYQEPTERPYLLVPRKSVLVLFKELLRIGVYLFASGED